MLSPFSGMKIGSVFIQNAGVRPGDHMVHQSRRLQSELVVLFGTITNFGICSMTGLNTHLNEFFMCRIAC